MELVKWYKYLVTLNLAVNSKHASWIDLTLVLLNPDIPCLSNSVDPDQLASEEAYWSWAAVFAIKYMN